MTTAERFGQQVPIAGVPWPAYKLVALAIGLVTLLIVGAVTASAAAAVLTAAGVCTAVWLGLGPLRRS
ncbi:MULTISPECIES: hypothetical protein [Mycolicibacter]|uniref:Uncharacterized protein n=1 Tax=Mycolicibacter virginiensis TaxID=1795032 RepID=A0A9X7IKA1_9MYCO|nr:MULTISPECIES: hypothetical protein [Mycobacteriaceae]OBG34095.1 hypothetical protein A5671_05190 [Mycolicibacter heraklionensis]OBJ29674.1 hypothetical protein A5631_02475 [Mycolicibacter heraklionensis]PQM50832.1 hypothetical protein C5U48_18035 [Mycolicibacter virginiensis]ULP45653.1 hypothetical protein MJO54_12175 [Mycolicibacter virginiensis]